MGETSTVASKPFTNNMISIPLVNHIEDTIVNGEYVDYKQQDSSFYSWLLSSINSSTKIMHLHCSLKTLRKRDLRMREYLTQIPIICDNLAACGNPLTETMHIFAILSGLPPEYEPVVAVITSNQQSYKIDGVCSVLLDTKALQQDFLDGHTGNTRVKPESPNPINNLNI
ncbi:hypothetical protein GQ457_10G007120 [Hibiscus cannabinus]